MSMLIPNSTGLRQDHTLVDRVEAYLSEKHARVGQAGNKGSLYFVIHGIKRALWFRVIKPELLRMAKEQNHYIQIYVEKPSNEWIEFEFVAEPVKPLVGVRVGEPPFTDDEMIELRAMLVERRNKNGQ